MDKKICSVSKNLKCRDRDREKRDRLFCTSIYLTICLSLLIVGHLVMLGRCCFLDEHFSEHSNNTRMNQIHQINACNCKENISNSCCMLLRRKGNSFSRQILRHGRCDGKDRNPDQVNPELFKAAVIQDLPTWANYHKLACLLLCWKHVYINSWME